MHLGLPSHSHDHNISSAVHDFWQARNRAAVTEILARLRGQEARLLSFDEVREKLKAFGRLPEKLEDIPLEAIVGSVGRYNDFTRDFLPRSEALRDRWATIRAAADQLQGLPPIEVYRIGEVYFVKDGNHRVSVARALGWKTISAYVTEIMTSVPLTPEVQPDDLILLAEYNRFLEITCLASERPEADLRLSAPGNYDRLLEHISVHRYYMGLEQRREISCQEAAAHFYDTVYLPIVQMIRERGILRSFPGRTEADLYLWLVEHRAALEEEIGWKVEAEEAIDDLMKHFSKAGGLLPRIGAFLSEALDLEGLTSGPRPGQWRAEKSRQVDRLFSDVLVPLDGKAESWDALDEAVFLAQQEDATLHGLHITSEEDNQTSRALRQEFKRRCKQAGVYGDLFLAQGDVAEQIVKRARWADLVVNHLAYPPPAQPLGRITSGIHYLIQRSPIPILAIPQARIPIRRALLAYDGSPKAKEALYLAAYLHGRWGVELGVISVEDDKTTPATLDEAEAYLKEHGVQATYGWQEGNEVEIILQAGAEQKSDLFIMGGYGNHPLVEVLVGSAVNEVLRRSQIPVLICR